MGLPKLSSVSRPSTKKPVGATGYATAAVTALGVGIFLAIAIALISGVRPVVIQTGSMGEAAPAGSLVIAGPVSPGDVQVGDVVVMQRPGRATVTHRVIGIDVIASQLVATTKGDANSTPDPDPYVITEGVLVSRTAIPGLGKVVGLGANGGLLFLIAGGLALAAGHSLTANRRRDAKAEKVAAGTPQRAGLSNSAKSPAVVAVMVAIVAASAGSALGLYSATATSISNAFSSSDCFTPEVTSVQKGQTQTVSTAQVDTPITAVDPARSFVIATVRSNSTSVLDSALGVELVGGNTVRVHKNATGASSNSVIEWSVVTYRCGITVQRGAVMGNDATSLQIPTNDSPLGSAFALISHTAGTVDRPLAASDHLAVEPQRFFIDVTAGVPIPSSHEIFWQSVRFDNPSDVSVQIVNASMVAGSTAGAVTLGQSIDPSSTFILAGTTADVAAASDSSMVRVHLVDPSTVALSRLGSVGPINTVLQVVTLLDGTTVRHGVVDFAVGETFQQIQIPTVDPAFTTAMLTVQGAGTQSGGQRGNQNSIIGEGLATAVVSDPQTVDLERGASGATASFGWEVIEWGGPAWPPGASEFRKRIDVTSDGSIPTPDGYTVPVAFDHAQLVNLGISQADGDDIRVMRFDGSNWTELDRIIDEGSAWNDPATTFWFQTADPIAAGETVSYWMYFGDPTPPPPQDDPENVWLVYETFDAGSLGDFSDQSGTAGWYEADPWTQRRSVTIAAADVTSELLNFPLLVRASGIASTHADAADIRFTAADGTTFLNHEVASWNDATGDLEAWVEVPFISSTADTTLWLYSGADNAPRSESERDLWPVTSTGVWHLDTDPTATPQVPDSSGTRDGATEGSMSPANSVAGVVGQSLSFDGIDDRIKLDVGDIEADTGVTASLWFLSAATTDTSALLSKSLGPTQFEVRTTAGNRIGGVLQASGQSSMHSGFLPDVWHHIMFTWDGTRSQIYVDGVERGNTARSGTLQTSLGELTIGDRADGTLPFEGLIDEVQLYGGGQGPGWALATYESQRPGSTFITVSAPQIGSWFAQGTWSFRTAVTVDASSVSTDLNSYPILVAGTHPGLTAAQADGDDLVFTSTDGITRLAHQLETFDAGTGAFSAWVNVPILAGGSTERLYLYYGNAGANSQAEPTSVFDADFGGVWHLSD